MIMFSFDKTKTKEKEWSRIENKYNMHGMHKGMPRLTTVSSDRLPELQYDKI
jgi:hypothetical protein